jgi:hypothetical protein
VALDAATIQKIIAHLKSTWAVQTCPMCKQNNWEIHGQITITLGGTPGHGSGGGQSLPCAAVICQVCGNSVIINLVVAGVVQTPQGPVRDPR